MDYGLVAEIIDINTLFGPLPPAASDLSVDDLTALMARHSIKVSCTLSTIGALLDHNAGNSATKAACSESPSLAPVATVNPKAFFGGEGAHTRFKADGFKLVRFFPAMQGWDPGSDAFAGLLTELAAQGLPIMIDTNDSGCATRAVSAAAGYGAAVILASIDEQTVSEAVSLARRNDNVYIETSNLLASGAISHAVDVIGPERLMFGSGAPSRPTASGLAALKFSGLSEGDMERVLGGNAKRVLGI